MEALMNKSTDTPDSHYIERTARSQLSLEIAKEAARIATEGLGHQEKFVRDAEFKASAGADELDGWLWDLAWSKAKEYYEDPSRVLSKL